MRHWQEDRAVSPVIATIMMVAIAAVLSVVVYAFAAQPQGGPPKSLSLTQGSPTSGDRSLSVAAASEGVTWGDFTPLLAGTPLVYDGDLATDGTWCKETPDGVCIATAAFSTSDPVLAGQRIRIHDADAGGKQFQLRDPEANALIATLDLR